MNGNEQYGALSVRVRSGFGIYPIAGAGVNVFSEGGQGGRVVATSATDESGNTPKMLVRTEGKNDAKTILPEGERFTVVTAKNGYQTVIVHGVTVYPANETVVRVNLAALPDRQGMKERAYDSEIEYSDGEGSK